MGIIEIKDDILKNVYKKRDENARKYDFGSLLVIGGSRLYSGSPLFNALAAYRAGVDLVTIAAPERAANIIASYSPNIIAYPLEGDYLNKKHLNTLFDLSKNKTAVVIGGGLCSEKSILQTINAYLKKTEIPCVIDADAIYALAQTKKEFIARDFVITPHAYEFFVLTGRQIGKDLDERIDFVRSYAYELQKVILLKGHVDVISDGMDVALNRTGCPYMTKGGMGDTLAGICGALLARKIDSFTAACAAAYINGKAGELASNELGESVTAEDLVNFIPKVLKFLIRWIKG